MRLHEGERPFMERRIHHLPAAGAGALLQGHHGAEGRVEPGDIVGERGVHTRRRRIGLAGEVAQPAHGLAHHPVAAPAAGGAGLAEAADPDHDQPRIGGAQRLVAEPPALHGAGAEVLDQDVCALREAADKVPAGFGPEIDGSEPLAPQDRGRIEGAAVLSPSHRAHRIAVGLLHLDDVGAEIGEQARAEGSRHGRAELDDPQPLQRPGCGSLSGRVVHRVPRLIANPFAAGRRPPAASRSRASLESAGQSASIPPPSSGRRDAAPCSRKTCFSSCPTSIAPMPWGLRAIRS